MIKRKNLSFITVMVLTFVLTIISPNLAAESSTTRLTLGTSTTGGTYFVLGGGWAKIMGENLDGVEISVQEGGGPATNIQLIQQGKMELGFATINVAYQGWHGLDWAKGVKYDKIRSIFPMYSSFLQIYTLDKNLITSIYDLEGKHVSTGTPGNTSEIAGKAVLEVLGVTPDKISMLSASGQIDALKDNITDANITVTGLPGPFMLDLETTHNPRLIGLSDEDLVKIREEYPSFFKGIIPKGTYKNQQEDIMTVAFWNITVASKDLSDDLVYNLVKATFDNKEALITVNPAIKQLSPENIQYCIPIPLHPGALKYYREIGVEIPESLLPPTE